MKVIDVTSEKNINKFNKSISIPDKKSIVYFHSPNCGHCKDFNPVWAETMAGMPDMKNSMVARVSADAMGLVNCDTNIDGFPTVLSMIGGKRKKEFRGKRNVKSLKRFIKRTLGRCKRTKRRNTKRNCRRRRKKKRTLRKKRNKSRSAMIERFIKLTSLK